MLGFFPLSAAPISALLAGIAPPPVVNKGGAPNYQYPGEADTQGINALFDTSSTAAARAARLLETRRALGLLPEPPQPPEAPQPPAEAPDEAPSPPDLAVTEAAAVALAELNAVVVARARAERIRRDDEDVLLLLSALT